VCIFMLYNQVQFIDTRFSKNGYKLIILIIRQIIDAISITVSR